VKECFADPPYEQLQTLQTQRFAVIKDRLWANLPVELKYWARTIPRSNRILFSTTDGQGVVAAADATAVASVAAAAAHAAAFVEYADATAAKDRLNDPLAQGGVYEAQKTIAENTRAEAETTAAARAETAATAAAAAAAAATNVQTQEYVPDVAEQDIVAQITSSIRWARFASLVISAQMLTARPAAKSPGILSDATTRAVQNYDIHIMEDDRDHGFLPSLYHFTGHDISLFGALIMASRFLWVNGEKIKFRLGNPFARLKNPPPLPRQHEEFPLENQILETVVSIGHHLLQAQRHANNPSGTSVTAIGAENRRAEGLVMLIVAHISGRGGARRARGGAMVAVEGNGHRINIASFIG
jgi:hypothetical protein